MGSVEVEHINGDISHETLAPRDSINKLHDLVNKLEEDNDIPRSPENSFTEFNGHIKLDENKNTRDIFLLENVPPIGQINIDTDLDSEDSWLYESPIKIQTLGRSKSSESWLKDKITTPELLRVRGSLSAQLEVIAYENRKDHYNKINSRKESLDNMRRVSKGSRHGSFGSVHSLDWDYDEEKTRSNRTNLSNEDLSLVGSFENEIVDSHYHSQHDGYNTDPESNSHMPPNIASQLVNLSKDRQAWSDSSRKNRINSNADKPFSLDWSDDEDLQPMEIDFSASSQPVQRRTMQIAPNPTIVKRSGSGLGLAAPRSRDNTDYHDLIAKPLSMVKPRKTQSKTSDYHSPTNSSQNLNNTFDISAPVIPRGSGRKDTASPRGATANIAKPVQRRTPQSDRLETDDVPRVRNSASPNQLRLRAGAMPKSHSWSDLETGLKINLPASSSNGPVIRRRGATPVAEVGPSPRRSKELSPVIARVQGIPQVRKSTGSIAQKSNENVARPRRSESPSGMVKPRGQVVSQSWRPEY